MDFDLPFKTGTSKARLGNTPRYFSSAKPAKPENNTDRRRGTHPSVRIFLTFY